MHVSPNDTNQYRYCTLSNGLRALLIHDVHAQKSAAALAVNVGHFDDPNDRQGMAHYLEHMLFLGTETTDGDRRTRSVASTRNAAPRHR